MIVEVVQVQPSEFGVGYCSGRIWINGVDMSRAYFSDFSLGQSLFSDMDNVEIMLCSRRNELGSDLVYSGNYDAMNFIWFKGSEGLYVPTGGKLRLF